MGMHVVMVGNPADGFHIVGPFKTSEHAREWAEQTSGEWWILPLSAPGQSQQAPS